MKSIKREDYQPARDKHKNPRLTQKKYQQNRIREIVENLPDQSLISSLVQKYLKNSPTSES